MPAAGWQRDPGAVVDRAHGRVTVTVMISSDAMIETPVQLRRLTQVALDDVREDATPLVAALAYGGVGGTAEERLRLGIELLSLPQLTGHELRTLATTLGFSNVADCYVSEFLDALLDHHALSPGVIVALFHNHTTDLVAHCPALCNPGDLAVAVAKATAGREVVRSASAVKFVEHVKNEAPAGVCLQLAYLLDDQDWSSSLWLAYEAAGAIQGFTVPAGPLESEWYEPLERPHRT